MRRMTAFSTLLFASVLAVPAFAAEPLDPADRSHVTFEHVANKLERQGYTEIKDIDNKQFDSWVEVHATNPEGERVYIRFDNTVGTLISERPLGN